MRTLILALVATSILAAESIPRLERIDGRYSLVVNDQPFLLLGGQVHNSSGWPTELETVWPQAREMHANTVEIPIYWEDFEPKQGEFNFETVDQIVLDARREGFRLVLLWFATWKNGAMDYAPGWVKADNDTYPRMVGLDGKEVRVLSPHSKATREADARAFGVFMKHLKEIDGEQRTVIMVQVQNEPGSLFTARDYSAASNELFAGRVPSDLTESLGTESGTWKDVFGPEEAEEAFAAYHVASYLETVAVAGKSEYPLPLSVNVWLRETKSWERPGEQYPSGGATSNMLDLWKAVAPHIDIIGPDLYVMDYAGYHEVCESYNRPDNPLMIPETGGSAQFIRYFFYAIADHGAIGFAPFGFNRTDGGSALSERLHGMAANYRLVGPAGGLLDQLRGTGKLKAAAEQDQITNQQLDFDGYEVLAQWGSIRSSYGGEFGSGTPDKSGRVMVGQVGPDEFYVIGFDTRVNFRPRRGDPKSKVQFDRVEEGRFVDGEWTVDRIWNGDQAFFGLRLPADGRTLRVQLRRY